MNNLRFRLVLFYYILFSNHILLYAGHVSLPPYKYICVALILMGTFMLKGETYWFRQIWYLKSNVSNYHHLYFATLLFCLFRIHDNVKWNKL